jgi:uncharacterized repeat protein (TIGR03847 family)
MARRIFNFENPDRFTTGTIGEPGSRTFYLQAREGSRISSVVLEKIQVALLAERLTQLLDEVREHGLVGMPDASTAEVDRSPLDEPLNEVFRVGSMTIVWNGDDESVTLEVHALDEDADEETEVTADDDNDAYDHLDALRVRLTPLGVSAFVKRAQEIVAAGRPPCPFCGQPLNPEGHICARRNGFMH